MPRRAVPALYFSTFLILFLLLATSLTFVYMAMIRPQSTILAGEIDVGGEQAGINIGYTASRTLTFTASINSLKPGTYTVGPTVLELIYAGTPNVFQRVTCPQRTVSGTPRIILCQTTISGQDLPAGASRLELWVRQSKVNDFYVPSLPLVSITVTKSGNTIVLNDIRYYPQDISRVIR